MEQKPQEPTMAQFDRGVSEAFDVLSEVDMPSIQEDRFVREFLPMFANRDGNPVNLLPWLDIAGHPHMPVNVFRGNTFLFRVPPLLRDATTQSGDRSKGQSIYQNITTAEQKRAILPALGEAHMRDHVINMVKREMASLEYIQAWNGIFKAYGYPEVELPQEAQAVIDEEKPVQEEEAPVDANDEISDFREL